MNPEMRRRHALPAVLALGTCLARPARAACGRELRVGVSLLGWGVFEEGGQLRGIVPDLLERMSQRSGCRLQMHLEQRARVMAAFQNGELDLITSAQRTADRDQVGQFLPYAYSGFDLVTVADEPPLSSVPALLARRSLRVGLVRGIQLSVRLMAAVERLAAQQRVEWANDFRSLSAGLLAGRYRGAIFPSVIHSKLRRDGVLPPALRIQVLDDDPPLAIGFYLHRQLLSAAQRQRLGEALRELQRQGEVEKIYARYLGADASRRLFDMGRSGQSSPSGQRGPGNGKP